MFTKVVLICMAALAVHAIEPYGHHGRQEYNHEPAHYSFHYQVVDHKTGDIKSHQEERQGDQTKGEYSLIEPDGSKRTVQYSVDKHSGFNAVVHREGGSQHPAPSHGHGAQNYGHGAQNYGHGAQNYGHGAQNYGHGAQNYGHGAQNYGHGAQNHGHASSYSSYSAHQSAPSYSHSAPIIAHHQPILTHHQPILTHHLPILTQHQPILAHSAPSHGGHARSSTSFSTHGAKIQTQTYHLAPQPKKYY